MKVGYLTYGTDAANMLFHVVNDRHRHKCSMIFTTNKALTAWGRVLHDDDLAHAIIDRVLERGRLLTLDGPSMRTKHLGLDDPVERLADNLHVIKDQYDGNTLVFIRAEGVVLVDTKSLRAGPLLLEEVRRTTGKPVTHILNTHHHFDHVGGNPSFPATVEVVAHEVAASRMTGMEEFSTPERRHGLSDRTFKDTLTLFPGPDAIDLHYFGPAHTDGDAFIVFRGPGVMHAGDTFPGVNVVARHGGSAEAYPTTMSRAASTISGVRTVVPGHGPLKTWQEFVESAAALRKR